MNRYNLSHNNEYTFIELSDLGQDNYQCCDNCGTPIRYVAEIKDSNGKKHFVGTECVQTLSKCKINNEYSLTEQIKAFKKVAAAKNLIKCNDNLKVYSMSDTAIIVGYNKNKKPVKIYIERTFDIFLQKYYSFIDSFLTEIEDIAISNNWCFNDIFKHFNDLKNNII